MLTKTQFIRCVYFYWQTHGSTQPLKLWG